MAKPLKKAQKRLEQRIDDYDRLPAKDKMSRKRPGSMKKRNKRR